MGEESLVFAETDTATVADACLHDWFELWILSWNAFKIYGLLNTWCSVSVKMMVSAKRILAWSNPHWYLDSASILQELKCWFSVRSVFSLWSWEQQIPPLLLWKSWKSYFYLFFFPLGVISIMFFKFFYCDLASSL